MPRSFVLETANNPGDAVSFALGGSPTGYRPWLNAIGSGVRDLYVMRGAEGGYEVGRGYPQAGTPNIFVRETVFDGSAGPGVRVNFPGQVDVYADLVTGSDGLLPRYALADAPIVELYRLSTFSVPHATGTAVPWDTVATNTSGGLDGSAPYYGVVSRRSRVHTVTAGMVWTGTTAGSVRVAEIVVGGAARARAQLPPGANLTSVSLAWTGFVGLGATMDLRLYQDTGAALLAGGFYASQLTVEEK